MKLNLQRLWKVPDASISLLVPVIFHLLTLFIGTVWNCLLFMSPYNIIKSKSYSFMMEKEFPGKPQKILTFCKKIVKIYDARLLTELERKNTKIVKIKTVKFYENNVFFFLVTTVKGFFNFNVHFKVIWRRICNKIDAEHVFWSLMRISQWLMWKATTSIKAHYNIINIYYDDLRFTYELSCIGREIFLDTHQTFFSY